ncbi:MAG: DNA-directed RNA polymerase subunit omega [Opitutus sp.]|nr:DNA-directed RNA polymerase subunit omega [Opitutus sp.]
MRNDYVLNAAKVIDDPYILVNVVSRRVKQLRHGHRPLIESLEKLSFEDTALREIAERKITYTVATAEELLEASPVRTRATTMRTTPTRESALRAHEKTAGASAPA